MVPHGGIHRNNRSRGDAAFQGMNVWGSKNAAAPRGPEIYADFADWLADVDVHMRRKAKPEEN
jgi:hypothetical protein